MQDHCYELEVVGRPHAVTAKRMSDSVEAIRHHLSYSGIRDNTFHVRRMGEHHFILTGGNQGLVHRMRDILIPTHRVIYWGEIRSDKERLLALSA